MTPEMPARISRLPRDRSRNNLPIPFFVPVEDGVPDFRVFDGQKLLLCLTKQKCWICGEKFSGVSRTFVGGPLVVVNRVSAEPPSHHECAIYAALACPFMTHPKLKRPDIDDTTMRAPGNSLVDDNPGVAALYTTRRFSVVEMNGKMFMLSEPTHIEWFAHARAATRTEVLASMNRGMEKVYEMADPEAHGRVRIRYEKALVYLPEED